MSTPYERDFHAWLQDQAALLKAGRLAELDIENLTEEPARGCPRNRAGDRHLP